MEKFSPFAMPAKLLFTPATRIVVTPPTVETEQFAKAVVMQVIAFAATPLSVNFRLNQLTPEALVKNNVPKPLLGTPKVKFVPTEMHPPLGQAGSRITMVGSSTESAKAALAQSATITTSKKTRATVEGFTMSSCQTC